MTKHIFKYKIDEENKCVFLNAPDNVNLENICNFMKKLSSDEHFSGNYSIIGDFRHRDFSLDENALKQYLKFIAKDPKLSKKRKVAILTQTPEGTAISLLYSLLSKDQTISVQSFTTLERSISWLNIPGNLKDDIENFFDYQ